MTTTAAGAQTPAQVSRPQRIVSTNYCTDQILLRIVEPERIQSLTFLSWKPGQTAPELLPLLKGIKQNHGLAEEVLRMKPDAVVGGEYSARFSNELLQKLGYRLYLIKTQDTFEEWYQSVLDIGDLVGEPERAKKLVNDFRSGLRLLQAQVPPGERPLYAALSVNYSYQGKDTLYAQIVRSGGFKSIGEFLNFQGNRTIPLEKLIRLPVELITSRSRYENPPSMKTQALQHPLLKRMVKQAYAAVEFPERYTVCTTPETLKMVELLVQARKDVDAAKAKERQGLVAAR